MNMKSVPKFRLLILMTIVLSKNLSAQTGSCGFSNAGVKINYTTLQANGNCLVNIDLSFDIIANNGQKFIYLHLWPSSVYPSGYVFAVSNPPDYNLSGGNHILQNAVATVCIDNSGATPVLISSYVVDPSAPVNYSGMGVSVLTNGSLKTFTITNLSLLLPGGCAIVQSISGIVWATQAASGGNVQCATTNFDFIANDPTPVGLISCAIPRSYKVSISTLSATQLSGTYDVYRDNGDGVYNPATDLLVKNDEPWTALSGTPYVSLMYTYAGNNVLPTSGYALFIVASTTGYTNTAMKTILPTSCSPTLPVSLIAFLASINNNIVMLNWKTIEENNFRHYEIERSTDAAIFQTVGIYFGRGALNTSADYQFSENLSSINGVTFYYRIKMVDNDGNYKYSNVLAVKKTVSKNNFSVYPNPVSDGNLFLDIHSDVRKTIQVLVYNMAGKLVYSNPRILQTGSNAVYLNLSRLSNGVYTIHAGSNDFLPVKIVVSK
jgi:hypothetical protein